MKPALADQQAASAATGSDDSGGHRCATYVSDPAFADVSIQALAEADASADDEDKVTYLFLADAVCMTDEEHRLLAVDLFDEPGRSFRLPPRWFPDVSTNLSIANLDFADFADAADESGTFRGFDSR
ncbi:DUF6924 domain-containing protein [Catellatospora methionotrophica]|uniref:DUF6924 domain-containing protein n=1 Tax=Catellatospora methionotrophica TaxID=121620 RepID=UPI003908A473